MNLLLVGGGELGDRLLEPTLTESTVDQ
jgi:hypothetical protein